VAQIAGCESLSSEPQREGKIASVSRASHRQLEMPVAKIKRRGDGAVKIV
jgi:hypothetical protein